MSRAAIIPETVSPRELADQTGWSERLVRETARSLDACLGRGRGMRLTHEDVVRIMEARRCPSKSRSVATRTTTAGRLPDGDYEALRAQRTKPARKELQPREKPKNGNVISMAPGRS
jgi:hypothetical protein